MDEISSCKLHMKVIGDDRETAFISALLGRVRNQECWQEHCAYDFPLKPNLGL